MFANMEFKDKVHTEMDIVAHAYDTFKKVQREFSSDAIARRDTFVKQVGKKYGVNIQFGNGSEGLEKGTGNGYYDSDTNTIVLDKNATVGDAMYAVLGHELTHVAERSGTYDELATAMLKLKYGKGIGNYRSFLASIENGSNRGRAAMDVLGTQSLYSGRLGRNVSVEYAAQEIIANITGDILKGNQDMAQRLAADNPGVLRRIIDSIKAFLNKLTGTEGAWKNDMQKAVDLLEKALEDAQNKQQGGRKYNLGNGEKPLSKTTHYARFMSAKNSKTSFKNGFENRPNGGKMLDLDDALVYTTKRGAIEHTIEINDGFEDFAQAIIRYATDLEQGGHTFDEARQILENAFGEDTYYRTKDLPMEEQLKIRNEMADKIEATYPYREGKQPQK